MNRLGIYFFFDKDGIVDDYVYYFLSKLRDVCTEICVVVNGSVRDEYRNQLEKYCDTLLIRENKGFDSWAYKHAIEYYGYDKLKSYDEVVLCNFTFFGPIYSLEEMFSKMETKNCDFWGIHKHPHAPDVSIAGVEVYEHIQSHFMVFKNTILSSPTFETYWQQLPPITSYEEAIGLHELKVTRYFEKRGFNSEVYINPEKYFQKAGNSALLCGIQQIKEDRCPILKRKIFFLHRGRILFPQLDETNPFTELQYIKLHTDFPIEYIQKNIRRCFMSKYDIVYNILKNIYLHILLTLRKDKEEKEKVRKRIKRVVILPF